MMYVNKTKLRVNLKEYGFLEKTVAKTNTGNPDQAIQSVVTYADLALEMDLTDEAAWLKLQLQLRQAADSRLQVAQ